MKRLLYLLMVALLVVTSCSNDKSDGIETGLEIASIPGQSEVFIASVNDLGISVTATQEQTSTERQLLGFRRLAILESAKAGKVVDSKYSRGKIPSSLPLTPGDYIVFLAAPANSLPPEGARPLDYFDNDSNFGSILEGFQGGRLGKTYLIEVEEGKKKSLIQLWQPRQASLAEMEKQYPSKESYKIDEAGVRTAISEDIPNDIVPLVLRLLKRGGKVLYRQGNDR